MRVYAVILFYLFTLLPLSAQTYPKVGLVLSGGGAKGAATVGVLKVLEEKGIQVDCIAGTSIGSIVGALYAAGYNASQLETMFREQDWIPLLTDHRDDLWTTPYKKIGTTHYVFGFPIYDEGGKGMGVLHASQVEEYIASLIYPRYLNELPSVECRLQNFRVYCLGEFGGSGVIEAENGRLNLLEAIAQAGDLTLQARRDNILLIRTDANGQRTIKRFNIQDANIMTMPEFELQQNDILYAQPTVYRARSAWSMPPIYTTAIGMLGTAMSLITFITVMAKK